MRRLDKEVVDTFLTTVSVMVLVTVSVFVTVFEQDVMVVWQINKMETIVARENSLFMGYFGF
jgi:hypothetical protein